MEAPIPQFLFGRCEQLANNDTTGEYQFPSFVEYTKSSVVTGLSAKRNMGRTKHYVVACVKRLIGLTYDEYEKLENKDIDLVMRSLSSLN